MQEKKEQVNQTKGSPLWFKTLISIILVPKIFIGISVLLGKYYTFMALYYFGALFAYIAVYYILLKVRKKLTAWDYLLTIIITFLL